MDELEKKDPESARKARGSIGLAEKFPPKGGDVVPKKGGGWFESRNNYQKKK